MNPVEPAVNETDLPKENVTVPATLADESADTAAEVNARAGGEEVSLFSTISGWLENILSLLFKPQADFIA
jgi:hypothetical protein